MAKPGRNDPCPCGSGNKYKRCCLPKDEAALREQFVAAVLPRLPAPDDRDFIALSESVPNLIKAGKLDEAEQAARELLARWPDDYSGLEGLGMVCEARSETGRAADYYRQALAIIRQHPGDCAAGTDVEYAERHAQLLQLNPPT
jgi:tetratricopeptide (TPR) repeat protein